MIFRSKITKFATKTVPISDGKMKRIHITGLGYTVLYIKNNVHVYLINNLYLFTSVFSFFSLSLDIPISLSLYLLG
jgi:hypothetical protein